VGLLSAPVRNRSWLLVNFCLLCLCALNLKCSFSYVVRSKKASLDKYFLVEYGLVVTGIQSSSEHSRGSSNSNHKLHL
jgi:hypothetical protein